MEPESIEHLQEFVEDEDARKIFAKVFDERVVQTLSKLADKGLFEVVEFVISTGKEAHVFRARTPSGDYVAVKIYKIETSDFRHMDRYVRGDRRFEGVKHSKRDLVYAWARKEFKNLERAVEAGVPVPLPLGFKENVLVMEFIGDNGKAAPPLHDTKLPAYREAYEMVVDWVARLFYKAELVHADLSEYNVLVQGAGTAEGKLRLIDIGQAVLRTHPQVEAFFRRDCENVSRFFSRWGVKKSADDVWADVKEAGEGM